MLRRGVSRSDGRRDDRQERFTWVVPRPAYMREAEPLAGTCWPSIPVTVDPAEQVRNRQLFLAGDRKPSSKLLSRRDFYDKYMLRQLLAGVS